MTRVAPFRHRKVKGQGHHGRLTLWHKISHIVATGRPTNFKFGMQLEYGDPRHRHSRWPQRSKVTVTTWRRQFDACLLITRRTFRDQLPPNCWLFVSNLRYSHVCVMKCCYVFVSVFLSVSICVLYALTCTARKPIILLCCWFLMIYRPTFSVSRRYRYFSTELSPADILKIIEGK